VADGKRGGNGSRDGLFGDDAVVAGEVEESRTSRERSQFPREPAPTLTRPPKPSTSGTSPRTPAPPRESAVARPTLRRRSSTSQTQAGRFHVGADREPVVREYLDALLPRPVKPGAGSLVTHPAALRTATQVLGVAVFLAWWALDGSARSAVRNVVDHSGVLLGAVGPTAALLAMIGALMRRRDIPREIADRLLCLFLAAVALAGTAVFAMGHPDPTGLAISVAALLALPVQMLTRRPRFDRAWLLGEGAYRLGVLRALAIGVGFPLLLGGTISALTLYSVKQLDDLQNQLRNLDGARCTTILAGDSATGPGFPPRITMLLGSHGRDGDLGRALATCATSRVDPGHPRMLGLRSTDGVQSLVASNANARVEAGWIAYRERLTGHVFPVADWLAVAEQESYRVAATKAIDQLLGGDGCGHPSLALELDLLRAASGPSGATACRNDYLDGTDQAAAGAALASLDFFGSADFYRMDLASGDASFDGDLATLLERLHDTAHEFKTLDPTDSRDLVLARPRTEETLGKVLEVRILTEAQVNSRKFAGQSGNELYIFLHGDDIEWRWIRETMARSWGFTGVHTPGTQTCSWKERGRDDIKAAVVELVGGGYLYVDCYKNCGGTKVTSGPEIDRPYRVLRVMYGEQSPCDIPTRSSRKKSRR
jgi:hypothetical protein